MEIKSIMELLAEEDELVHALKAIPHPKKSEITNLEAAIRMKRCQIAKALSPLHNYGINAE